MKFGTLAVGLFLFAAPAMANAQVSLAMRDGLVTLNAKAPVTQILNEWARVGNVTIVNGEKIGGPLITIELTGVAEREALATLLRGVSGYALGLRPAGTPGAAVFNRIIILPTSSTPLPPRPVAESRPPVIPVYRNSPSDDTATLENEGAPRTTGNVTAFTGPEQPPREAVRGTFGPLVPPGPNQPGPEQPATTPATAGSPNPFFTVPTGGGMPGSIAPVPPTRPDPRQSVVR